MEHSHKKKSDSSVYILEGLCCANCAAKIEHKIRQMTEIEEAVLTFPTKQLRITSKSSNDLLPKIQRVIDSVEDGVTAVPKEKKPKAKTLDEHHSHSHTHTHSHSEDSKTLISIGLGTLLFIAGGILEKTESSTLLIFVMFALAYLHLGKNVLLTAAKNIKKGHVFDENFLMSLATLGAFAIREWPEAVGVMLFYRIGEYFEHRAIEKSRSQIMNAVDMRPEVVNLVTDGSIETIPAENALVGQILLVRPGDRIPLDGVILEGESRIDTSPITGEPVPVHASIGDSVISGCVNTSGQLKIRVEKILEESMVTRILNSVENAAASKPHIDKFITRFARVYTPFVVIFALLVAILPPLLLPNWHFFVNANYTGATGILYGTTGTASIFTALTFLVISCPCALVLSVPLAFFAGIGSASKKGILFKGGAAIESLKNIHTVVMDKTGTITKGNFMVQHCLPAQKGISSPELLALGASCELSSTHPIGCSIVEAAKEQKLSLAHPKEVEEIAGYGIRAVFDNGTALCGNRKLMQKENIDLSAYKKELSGTEVLVAFNGSFIGSIVIADTIKADASSAISRIKKSGILTAMLTGDSEKEASVVAQQTGIDEIHAKLLPDDKFQKLQEIRKKHGSVMFVGDGINDAPVLAGADVGAAMGTGADAAIEAADVVFMTSEVMAIPEAIQIAKETNKVAWQNVYFALAIKLIVLLMGLFGYANMWIAVFADTGVSFLCLLNSIRILYRK